MIFNFSIDGYFRNGFKLILEDDKLLCKISKALRDYETTVILVSDDPDWKNLLLFLSKLKWKAAYDTPVLDGTQWSFHFKTGKFQITSHGSNGYPQEFEDFLILVNNITKKHGIDIH